MTALEVIAAARRGEVGSREFTDVPIACRELRPGTPGLGRPRNMMLMPGGIDLGYLRYELGRWNVVRPWQKADDE